jgi:GNAT superfamily N-acetyltransferase
MPVVDVKVFYLEMFARPAKSLPSAREDVSVIHVPRPSVAYYRALYNGVGKEYYWHSRGTLPDTELESIIQDPREEMHVVHVAGQPAGFAELDRRQNSEIELVQFGLLPAYIGQGLGRYFLHWTVEKAWSYGPRRFWLHTCTLDHPTALPNYLKAGFKMYKEEMIQREIPPR